MEKILFIAGGLWQRPFVEYLKNKGHYVAIVNPIVTETTQIADYHIKADVNDLDIISEYMQEIKPIFITTDQSDISTTTVSKLSERFNLPGLKSNTIKKLTDKFEIYKFAKNINIPVPESKIVENIIQIKEFGSEVGYPIIIKPTDATMSRGFRKFEKESEISEEIFLHTKKFSKKNKVIAQIFLEGEMVTLDGICSGGKHRTIAVSKKEGYIKPGITIGMRYPFSSDLVDKMIQANDQYVETAEMPFGLTHSEYIFNDNQFWLLEIGGRGGGAGITNKITPWVSGVNNYDILYQSLIGEIIDVKSMPLLKRSALLRYYTEKEVINYTNNIKQIKGVAEFNYNFKSKQFINDENDVRHTMAIYLTENEKELIETETLVNKLLNPNPLS